MKRNIMLAIAIVGILFASRISLTSAAGTAAPQSLATIEFTEAELARSQQGLNISPVPINAGAGRTRILIGLGSYLVNAVGGCNDCHTNPPYLEGGDPFRGEPTRVNAANYLAGGARFGPFTSRNLTPDPEHGNRPAGLTLEQFIHVIRTGEDIHQHHPEVSPLLQVMPWPVYRNMSNRDLQAIYLYLSVIPHAEPAE